jgi:NAD(P)-dependent dehydrogenase (short-subunit alcohol dehydrogenase family)
VAVHFAREGADVAIVYLPDEQGDAEETKTLVEKEGRRCLLLPGDVSDPKVGAAPVSCVEWSAWDVPCGADHSHTCG